MTEHTPTPWHVDLARWTPDAPVCGFGIRSAYSHPGLPEGFKMHSIASANISERAAFTACFTAEEIEANAAFIVKAVNSHDRLIQALQFVVDGYDNQDVSHVDFRVKVYEVALDALASVTARPFYGAECPSYPNCDGGCGLGCTKEIERAKAPVGGRS